MCCIVIMFMLSQKNIVCVAVSIFLKGEQMLPVLNGVGVNCAVYGNHDFGKDFLCVQF